MIVRELLESYGCSFSKTAKPIKDLIVLKNGLQKVVLRALPPLLTFDEFLAQLQSMELEEVPHVISFFPGKKK